MEWGAYLKKYLDGPDMAEMSWNPSIGDPDHMMYMLLSSDRFPPAFNAGFFQNARVDELLRKGRTTVDDAGAHPALHGSPAHHRRGGAVDLHRPRQAGDHPPQARAGLQAPPELRPRAVAGVAAVGGGGGLPAPTPSAACCSRCPVLFGVSVLVFAVMHLAPGDPAAIMLGAQATKEDVERLRRDLGLDQPLVVQYLRWMGRVVQGDLGRSIPLGPSVLPEVLLRFKATLVLTAGALVIAVVLGLAAGIVSAIKQYSWLDKLSMGVAVTGVSLPVFWTGIMLIIVFALQLRLVPVERHELALWQRRRGDVLWHLVLPAITLGTASAAALARLTRSSVLEIIRQDYVRSARAKGLAERAVIARHVLKNAINPIITVLGVQVGFLLGGAILTETVFSWPGLGSMMVRAIQARDYPLVQGGVLLIATTFVVVNLAVDLLYAVFDPRIRYE